MDYIQEDPYSSLQNNESPYSGHYEHGGNSKAYGTINYSAIDNTSYERDQSPRGSHLSLQSAGSNRYNPSAPKTELHPEYESRMRTSMSSLKEQEHNGNYARYTSMGRVASPHGSTTPTRFTNPLMSNYHNLPGGISPRYTGSPSPSMESKDFTHQPVDHYDSIGGRDPSYPGSRTSYQGEQRDDYGNYSDHNHLNSPYGDQHYAPSDYMAYGEDHLERQNVDQSYSQRPDMRESDDPYYAGSGVDLQKDGYPGERNSYQDAPYDPYMNSVDVSQPRDRNSYQTQEEPYVVNPNYADTDLDGPSYRNSYAKDENPYKDINKPEYRGSLSSNRPDDPYHYNAGPADNDPVKRYEGLPPVQTDPFANDPFRDGESEASYNHRQHDPYQRGPSPNEHHDRYAPAPYEDNLPPYEEQSYRNAEDPTPYNDADLPHYNDYMDHPDYVGETRPYYPETREDSSRLLAPVNDYAYSDGRRTPSDGGRPSFNKPRPPDLQEVIDYLSDEDNDVKAHAAAYLQHLCFMDDDMKAKTRGLDGIRPLVQLLSNDFPEVIRNACGALQNLSYGKANNDNKKAIKNANGIPELFRLLRKTQDDDIKESVTGILWNLSSCEDLKRPIIDEGLAILVNTVIIPESGVQRVVSSPYRDHDQWTTLFRNGTGVIRNVSSAGYEARKRLRECRGLVNALIHTLKQADTMNLDNKPIENVVCTLRNLSYRIQEVQDPDFFKKRYNTLQRMEKDSGKEKSGCFGGGSGGKKKGSQTKGEKSPDPNHIKQLPAIASEYKALWSNDLIQKYLILIKNTSNPVTLEAGAGAIQNLVACDWPPAVEIRGNVRKEKGLPHLVDLLAFESDRVVCASATALRNLAIDERNKELVGKYAMRQLVSKLPQDTRHSGVVPPDDTLCAVIATLYEVVKNNQDFAQSFFNENGVPRLMSITMSEGKYLARTIKYASTVLRTLWQFKALHSEYSRLGYTEANFVSASGFPRPDSKDYKSPHSMKSPPNSNHTTPYNTLSRPISAQGYDDNTLSHSAMQKRPLPNNNSFTNDGYHTMGNSNSALHHGHMDNLDYHSRMGPVDEIPMSNLGIGTTYSPIDSPRSRPKNPGGVPRFANASPNPVEDERNFMNPQGEPLYAQVNKGRRRQDNYAHSNELVLDSGVGGSGGSGAGGADSWV